MIIYAPYIGDTIPAFTSNGLISIPFSHNPAVSNYTGMSLRILNFTDNQEAGRVELTNSNITSPVKFEAPKGKLAEGLYYKCQIAYTDGSDGKLYYSNIAIGKCVAAASNPIIVGLDSNTANYDRRIYLGRYESTDEPAYWYRFVFTDPTGHIMQDTGDQLAKGEEYEFELKSALEYGKTYKIKIIITTANGLKVSQEYSIVKRGEISSEFTGTLVASANHEEGYIELGVTGTAITGDFRIYRSTDGTNWDVLVDIIKMLSSDILTSDKFKWRDYTVMQGHKYQYGLAQLGDNKEVSMIKSITAPACYFEDMFLGDGEKQLKIKLNPKVSSFKEVVLEAKTDTMGSKYPFFTRNAAVGYKEIPVSGLISYWMDEAENFMSDAELGLSSSFEGQERATAPRTTSLEGYNYAAERKFKLAVLDWLNNGRPKLFRSPAEGNYMVRLMNISLSPNDTLGRLIHTFSATGYECGKTDIDSLRAEKLLFASAIDNTTVKEVYHSQTVSPPDTATYSLRNASDEIVIPGPANNIVLQTITPSGSYFFVNNTKFLIYGTTYAIGSIQEGEVLRIPNEEVNYGMVITYSTVEEPTNVEPDKFKELLANTITVYEQIELNEARPVWTNEKYPYIYSLKASGNGREVGGTIQFGQDGEIIVFGADDNREYPDLGVKNDVLITAKAPLTLTISAQQLVEETEVEA